MSDAPPNDDAAAAAALTAAKKGALYNPVSNSIDEFERTSPRPKRKAAAVVGLGTSIDEFMSGDHSAMLPTAGPSAPPAPASLEAAIAAVDHHNINMHHNPNLGPDGMEHTAAPDLDTASLCRSVWTAEEEETLRASVLENAGKPWSVIAAPLTRRTEMQCLQHWKTVLRPCNVKGQWSAEEDEKLRAAIEQEGTKKWTRVAAHLEARSGKQCRERWLNHMTPNIIKTPYTPEEDKRLMQLQAQLGNKWCMIAKEMPGRTGMWQLVSKIFHLACCSWLA
jgi:Myb-like DNA-binding domain